MKKRILALVLGLLMVLSLQPVPSMAAAGDQSGSRSLPKLSQTEIADLIKAAPDTLSEAPFETEPSVTAPYAAGKVKGSALQAAADRLTMLRRLAGLPAVELDDTLNEQAQYGAVLLAASAFSHTPARPADMSDDFYQKGYAATSSSNIYYYASSGRTLTNSLYAMAKAPDGFMDDSDASNVSRVGHRRWQLNPSLKKIGFGFAMGESDGWIRQYVDEKVWDTSGSVSDYDFIAWPASGNFPNNLSAFNKDSAWSVTLNPGVYATPGRSSVTVTLTRSSDGKSWTFSGSENNAAADSGKYFTVETGGYGVSNCIIFRPDGVDRYEGDYTVQINGLKDSAGKSASLQYEVSFFDPGSLQTAAPKPAVTIPAIGIVYPSTQTVDLDGKQVEFQMYMFIDADGGETNFIRVRDLALVLNGTKAQFSVDWNGAVNLVAGAPYTPDKSENSTPFSGERSYKLSDSRTNVNGAESDLLAIVLTDDAGGGYTYYQLRDLGKKLGFNVDWTEERGVFIESDKPYSGEI